MYKKSTRASSEKGEDKIQKKVEALRENLKKRKKQVRVNENNPKAGNN